MTEFLFLFRGGDSRSAQQSPEKMQAHMQRWMQWMDDLNKKGQLSGAQPLKADGKIVKGTKKAVTDGPYAEGKEIVGGYLICKAENFDDALKISKNCPILEFDDGTVEVREISELSM